jgi:hypothetical protein
MSTFAATVVALATAVIFTRRQTRMAERAAANARVSADAALGANLTARKALDVASEQLAVAAREVGAVERQAALALETLHSSRRPVLLSAPTLLVDAFSGAFHMDLSNVGNGPGRIRDAVLVMPDTASCSGVSENAVVAVGGTTKVTFEASAGPEPPPGRYEVVVIVINVGGTDPQEFRFAFRRDASDATSTGPRLYETSTRSIA